MTESRLYIGTVEDVLSSGEYDQGDLVQISYDELFDVVEQAKEWQKVARMVSLETTALTDEDLIRIVERNSNRPVHPVLGGSSPYTEFLPV